MFIGIFKEVGIGLFEFFEGFIVAVVEDVFLKVFPILLFYQIAEGFVQQGLNKPLLRLTIEGIFYRLRVGCPWRDLPKTFGHWSAIYKRFNEWSREEKLSTIFKTLVVEPDLEWEFIDGSIVKAHQHSSGAATPCCFSFSLCFLWLPM